MTDTNMPQNSIDEIKRTAIREYALMMCVPVAVAVFINGISAIINIAISLVTCWIFASVGKALLDTKFPPKTYHTVVIGTAVAAGTFMAIFGVF